MKIDKSIVFLIVLAALILGYFMFFYCDVKFELKDEVVRVNIYDTIDLKNYIYTAKDSTGKKLYNKVKITVDGGELDKFKNNKLFVGDFSNKTVTYKLKYKFKTFTKTLDIMVISDPNDPDFKPNPDYISEVENTDDVPEGNINSNLNEQQRKYLETLKK